MHTFNQVKLIITDMDGTLLDSKRQLPADLFSMIRNLSAHGIRFAVGSGRSYPTLADQFAPVADLLVFIAENGACLVDGHTLITEVPLTEEQVLTATEKCRDIPDIFPVYSCLKKVYVMDSYPDFVKQIIHDFYFDDSIALIHSVEDIPEPVYKVTVCAPFGGEETALPVLSQLPAPYLVTLSGQIWIDICLDSCSKGNGVRAMQKHFGITYDETMIFGDYLNDLSMMDTGYFSYAMANAHPKLFETCRFRTLSNDEDGVMHIVRQVLDSVR